MADRLWSGPGCEGDPAFEFVKHSDTGVPLYRKVAPGEVELRDGGATFIVKRAGSAPEEKEVEVTSISEAIAKALVPDASDTDREATDKALVRKQLETGALKADQFGAELALESHAATLRKSNPDLSAEQAFVKAMDQHPDLARLALG